MALSIASVATGPGGQTGSTVVVSKPSGGWVDGNRLILFTAADIPVSGTIGIPAAFTGFPADTDGETISGWRDCSSEPTSYTIPMASGSAAERAAIIVEVTGHDSGIDPVHATAKSGNNKTATFNAVTSTVDGSLILAFVGVSYRASSTAFGTPTGFNPEATDQSGVASNFSTAAAAFSFTQATKGAITPGNSAMTDSATAANHFWGTAAIAIAPAAATNPTITSAATIDALTQSATLKAIAKINASPTIPAFTQSAALKAIAKITAAASMGLVTQTAAAKAIAKITSATTLANFTSHGVLTTGAAKSGDILPIWRRRGRR